MVCIKEFVGWIFPCRAKIPSWLAKSLILSIVLLQTACTKNPENGSSPSPSSDTPQPSASASLLDNLEDDDDKNQFGGEWYTYNDKGNGGDSQVSPSDKFKPSSGGANNSSWSARMTGTVKTTYKDGFIGMGTKLSEVYKTPVDLSKYKGISFCAEGDGKEYLVKLRSQAINDYNNDYGYKFVAPSQWQCYQVPFEEMKADGQTNNPVPLNKALTEVTSIQWQTIGQPHESVELAVDDIKFLN